MSIGARIYAELQGDRAIWAIMAVLAIFSILTVYSSTGTLAYRAKGGDTEFYLLKHTFILVGGLFLTYLCYMMHYTRFQRAAPYMILLAIPLLIYTVALGPDINDARRWIEIPYVGITFQTSDFAKIALITLVAREITKHKDYIKDFNNAFLPIIVPILIICGLIAPADLSTSLILFTTCVLMMFIGRVSVNYIFLLLLLGLVVFAFLIVLGEFTDVIRSDTWKERLQDFGTGEIGYQIQQSKIAIANGEWFGSGPGNSIQRNYLPSPYADFIYAIIAEEYGLIGALLVICLYVLLFFRTTRLVTKSPKAFGAMLAVGLSLSLVIQALANIGVAVNVLPVTGLTLPMISMGGTSVLFTCIAFGMILSVSKYIEKLD